MFVVDKSLGHDVRASDSRPPAKALGTDIRSPGLVRVNERSSPLDDQLAEAHRYRRFWLERWSAALRFEDREISERLLATAEQHVAFVEERITEASRPHARSLAPLADAWSSVD